MMPTEGYYDHNDTNREWIELKPSDSSLAFGYLAIAVCLAQVLLIFALLVNILMEASSFVDMCLSLIVPLGIAAFTWMIFRKARFHLTEVKIDEGTICTKTIGKRMTLLSWSDAISIEFLNSYTQLVQCRVLSIDGLKIEFLTDKEKPHLIPSASAMLFGKPVSPGYNFLVRKKMEIDAGLPS